MSEQRPLVGHLLALLTIMVWGTTFVSTKVLLTQFSPLEILVLRFVIGYCALWAAYPKRLPWSGLKREAMFIGAGISGVTLYFLLENIALTYTYASNVGVIVAVSPMFTALLAGFLLEGEHPGKRFLLGFAAAILGILMISFSGSALHLNPLGDLLAFLAAFAWAVYSILIRKMSAWGYHTIQTTRKIFGYGLLFMLPALGVLDFRWDFSRLLEPFMLPNLLYLGLGASALCFVTWGAAVKILGAVKTSVYIYLVPVVTIAASAVVLKEQLTWMGLLGMVFALSGLAISQKDEKN